MKPTLRRLGQNLTEKIVQRHAVGLPNGKKVHLGDYVSVRPRHCMTHDNTWPVALKFQTLGAKKIHDNRQVVMTLDHDVQNRSPKNLEKYRNIEEFARRHGVDFYPAGAGIGHQIMLEQGYAFPGAMVVASDSHSNTYGGIGALGTPVVRTDAAAIWATGTTWWQIPPVARVILKNQLPRGTTGKDVIVSLCGLFNNDEVLNHAIEFSGEGVESLSIDYRLTIANMTTEWGALSGVFPVDLKTRKWYESRLASLGPDHARINKTSLESLNELEGADPDAKYAKTLVVDLATLSPRVSGPNSVKVSNSLAALAKQNIKVNKAYLVLCTNLRLSDIEAAAKVLKGRHIAPGVQFYVAAALKNVEKDAQDTGAWQTILDAGATPLPAGCGPCIGLGAGLLEPGEVGISATNRNFKGRMGLKEAKAYLALPEVVAALAVLGRIGLPEEVLGEPVNEELEPKLEILEGSTEAAEAAEALSASVEVLEDFPKKISGELVFCDADNINTDGIYPGKYTYQDDVPREKMAEVCMENYDAEFGSKTRASDIVVSGFNFGTGSSREQAATAILARGMRLIVAGSFGNIFSRNSVNNALLTLEIPALVSMLRERYKDAPREATRRTGWTLTWDVEKARVEVRGPEGVVLEQKVGELGTNLQEIIVRGGLEGWVRGELAKQA